MPLMVACGAGQPGIAGQLAAARITAGQHHLTLHQHQRQPLLPGVGEKGADRRCFGKLQRLLGQIETLDGNTLLLAQARSAAKVTSA